MSLDLDELWDSFCRARQLRPGLSASEYSRTRGADEHEARTWLETALAFEALEPPAPLVEGLAEGVEFAGYRLGREVGRGGFGLVYEARGAGDEVVALKILNPLVALDGSRQQELLREARVAAGLEHASIVRVLACGIERGHAWFASELVRGEPLTADALGRSEGSDALELGQQLADALAHAHSRGVTHRDLKPANVLLDREGRVRVLDFGLARVDEVSISTRGRGTGDGAGTPQYMAPEQLGRGPVGAWSDVYAIGLVVLGLVAPGAREWILDPQRVRERLGARAAGPPAHLLRGLAPDLRRVLGRALEPEPADRYRDAGELAADLSALRAGHPLPHGRPGAVARTLRSWRRRPLRALLPSLVLLAALLALRHFWWLAPVPVYFDALLSGKLLHVDGVQHGVVPTTVHLRPGRHHATLQYGNQNPAHPVFEHSFELEPRRPRALVLPLNYWTTVPALPELGFEAVPAGDGAWVVLAVRESPSDWDEPAPWHATAPPVASAVRLRLLREQGEVLFDGVVPPLCQFRVPQGTIRIELDAEGYRPAVREAVVGEDRLALAPFALDRLESPWHTLVLYGPLDLGLEQRIVARENLRLYIESMHVEQRGVYANIAYYGQEDPARGAALTLRLELPLVPVEIQGRPGRKGIGGNYGAHGWVELRAGPGPGELTQVFGLAGRTEPDPPAQLAGGWAARTDGEPDSAASWAAATSAIVARGSRELWLDYALGPGPAGDVYAYIPILRSEALPRALPGELLEGSDPAETDFLWRPAIVLRVR